MEIERTRPSLARRAKSDIETLNVKKLEAKQENRETKRISKRKEIAISETPSKRSKRSSDNLESEAEQSMKLQCPGAGLLRIPVQKPKMPAVASDDGFSSEFHLLTAGAHLTVPADVAGEEDLRTVKLTDFQIYDSRGFLLGLDQVKDPKKTYYVCGIAVRYDNDEANVDTSDGIPVTDVKIQGAPWLAGFGKGDFLAIGISTEYFEMYLLRPHKIYEPLYAGYKLKCDLTKALADFLIDNVDTPDLQYETFAEYLEKLRVKSPAITLDSLTRNMGFVSRHIAEYDDARDGDEPTILNNEVIKYLEELSPDAKFAITDRGSSRSKNRRRRLEKREAPEIPITPVVGSIFTEFCSVENVCDENKNENPVTKEAPGRRSVEKVSVGKARENEEDVQVQLLSEDTVRCGDQLYKVGDGAFLPNDAFEFKYEPSRPPVMYIDDNDDPKIYTEKYRKLKSNSKEKTFPKPFLVVRIIGFYKGKIDEDSKEKDVFAVVRKFYRPEDTSLALKSATAKDLNMLYISGETEKVWARQFVGRCAVYSKQQIVKHMGLDKMDEYFQGGKNRFYFEEVFDAASKRNFQMFQNNGKWSEEGPANSRFNEVMNETAYPKVKQRLRTMDLFAGCGGFSNGLERSGVAETLWAIEIEENAAKAFMLNHPKAQVFCEDCNVLLAEAKKKPAEARLPAPGQVDLLVGGPPCQGFSGMNRFSGRDNAAMKNRLIVSYLCYVEYYNPKFVIMENVRNLKTHTEYFDRLTRCLRSLGYHVTDQVLQAGLYGVPQSRNRIIVMASRQDQYHPDFPRPITSFFGEHDGAPLRALTVADGISDLDTLSGVYAGPPGTHYQRMMRESEASLSDHVSKPLSDLNNERVKRIPKRPNADWRDLPNIALKTDKIVVMPLKYKNGTKIVLRSEQQDGETLIPWCLPNTADKHKWVGLYGRLNLDGAFPTMVTSVEPMGRQGRVIHPNQDRLITVREAARAQGFRDDFKFAGEIGHRYTQVGNAVPPPLAEALGHELLACVAKKEEEEEKLETKSSCK